MKGIEYLKKYYDGNLEDAFKLLEQGINVPEWKDGLKRYLKEEKENEEQKRNYFSWWKWYKIISINISNIKTNDASI